MRPSSSSSGVDVDRPGHLPHPRPRRSHRPCRPRQPRSPGSEIQTLDRPSTPPRLAGEDADIFQVIRAGDLLVHHPYEGFSDSVEQFIATAVMDPKVLAIKMTLYRTAVRFPLPAFPYPRRRVRQTSRRPGRTQSPLRRAAQRPARHHPRKRRRSRRLRPHRPQNPLQDRHGRPRRARRFTHLLPHRHRQLQLPHRPALHRPRPLHLRHPDHRRRHRSLPLSHRPFPQARLSQAAGRPGQSCASVSSSRSAARSSTPAPAKRPASSPR